MIKIAGLQKLTLIDYPFKLAAIIFTYGCNLRCEYCHNPELVTESFDERFDFNEERILDFLRERKGKLDALVITGGEPLIYDDLPVFIKKVKDLGYLVKLDTNGLLPQKLKGLMDRKLLDYVAMDIKYPKEGYIKYIGEEDLKKVKDSISMIIESGLDYEFRTTYVKGIHDLKSSAGIGKLIKGAGHYYIQNFRPGKTINPTLSSQNSFTDSELEILKKNIKHYVQNVEIRQ